MENYEQELVIGQPFNPYLLFGGVKIPNRLLMDEKMSDAEKLLFGKLLEVKEMEKNCQNDDPFTKKDIAECLGWDIIKLNKIIHKLRDKKRIRILKTNSISSQFLFEFI